MKLNDSQGQEGGWWLYRVNSLVMLTIDGNHNPHHGFRVHVIVAITSTERRHAPRGHRLDLMQTC